MKEGIESRQDAGEPEKKKKGSNLGAMSQNKIRNQGIKSGHGAGEPETK